MCQLQPLYLGVSRLQVALRRCQSSIAFRLHRCLLQVGDAPAPSRAGAAFLLIVVKHVLPGGGGRVQGGSLQQSAQPARFPCGPQCTSQRQHSRITPRPACSVRSATCVAFLAATMRAPTCVACPALACASSACSCRRSCSNCARSCCSSRSYLRISCAAEEECCSSSMRCACHSACCRCSAASAWSAQHLRGGAHTLVLPGTSLRLHSPG